MAYKNPFMSVAANRIERVEGVDLGIIDKDFVDNMRTLVVVDPKTKEFHVTAPIVEFARAQTHIYVKDANGVVYTNSAYYEQKFREEIEKDIKAVKLSLADAIAIKCINDNKTPVIIEGFTSHSIEFINSSKDTYKFSPELVEALTRMKNSPELFADPLSITNLATVENICKESGISIADLDYAKRCGVTPKDIVEGLQVFVSCQSSQEVGTHFKTPSAKVYIPHLQDFGYENGLVAIQSRSKCFTNVPEVAERYEQRQMEKTVYDQSAQYMTVESRQQHESYFHNPEPFGNNAFYAPGDLQHQSNNNNFFHAPGDIGEDGPGIGGNR